MSYVNLKQYDKAIPLLEELVREDNLQGYYYLSRCMWEKGDKKMAIELIKIFLDKNKDETYRNRALSWFIKYVSK